ncbi:protein-export chaperone SecB [Orenia marismortui]|uniref:protein-export chaperone SecB n=1 Tax=Orenia marismortui TaxID=46469 RepID=UPI00037E734C|nr:protein-export chaperone SecB [Orenia marismortui]
MTNNAKSQFYFDDYRIENINFEMNNDFKNGDVDVDFDADFNLNIYEEENKGLLNIEVKFWENAAKDSYPFELSISIIGVFSSDPSMDKEQFETMCKYNGAAILFPYIRSAITDITKVANLPSLILPTINIRRLIDQ